MTETIAVVGALWDLTSTAFVFPVLWGIGLSALAFGGFLALWFVARKRGWLEVPSGRAWPRRLVLALWLVVLVPMVGLGGVVYGAQRATLDALDETQVIQGTCGVVAKSVVLIAVGETDPESTIDRIPVASIRELWADANAEVDGFKDEKIQAMVSSQIGEGVTADAAALVGGWSLDALQSDLVGDHTDALEEVLEELEGRAASDGTVGTSEATEWLADEYLMPSVRSFIVSLFRPYYVGSWFFVLAGLGLPLMLMRWSRRKQGPNQGEPAVASAGGYPPQPQGGYPPQQPPHY